MAESCRRLFPPVFPHRSSVRGAGVRDR
jgi:hypothetical protein